MLQSRLSEQSLCGVHSSLAVFHPTKVPLMHEPSLQEYFFLTQYTVGLVCTVQCGLNDQSVHIENVFTKKSSH